MTAGTSLTPEQLQVRALALGSDVDGLVSLVANHRLEGLSVARICDGLIAPVMRELGEAWMAGRLSPAQEHIASNTVKDMLARVRPLVERNAKVDRGRALCACLGKEQHDLGVRMVGLILASEGYRSVMAGANVPATDLAMMASSEPPAVLALSASPTGTRNVCGVISPSLPVHSAARVHASSWGATVSPVFRSCPPTFEDSRRWKSWCRSPFSPRPEATPALAAAR